MKISIDADAAEILDEYLGNSDAENYSDVIRGMHELIEQLTRKQCEENSDHSGNAL